MANEQLFNHRAKHYTNGRPGYADGISTLLLHDLLNINDQVADIGSGTGLFAKLMIEHNFDVFCVEPNQEMLAQAQAAFASNPHFIPISAAAESTTLAEHSIDFITVASAFHWFDAVKFRTECKRILKPSGIFFAVANSRDYKDDFTICQHNLCLDLCKNFTSLHHGLQTSRPLLHTFLGHYLNYAEFDFPLEYTKEKFIQRSLSSSYAPDPNTIEYQKYIEGLWLLMDEFAPNQQTIIVPNTSVAYWGKLF